MMKKTQIFLITSVLLSLLFHLWMWWGVDLVATYFPYVNSYAGRASDKNIVEIEFIESKDTEEPPKIQKKIVTQAEVPEELKIKDLNQKTDLLSEKVQRVLQEMQARLSGPTKNQQLVRPRRVKSKDSSNTPEFLSQVQPSPSTLSSYLEKDIPIGDMTVLNTDQYVYYSFYSRIDDLVYDKWQTRVRELQYRLPLQTLRDTPRKGWLTQAEFILSPEGKLIKAIVLKPSGVDELDRAALRALKEAAVFPNPPKGMILEDGLVHVFLGFTVRYSPTIVGEK